MKSNGEMWRDLLEKRATRERHARALTILVYVLLTVALFYSATN